MRHLVDCRQCKCCTTWNHPWNLSRGWSLPGIRIQRRLRSDEATTSNEPSPEFLCSGTQHPHALALAPLRLERLARRIPNLLCVLREVVHPVRRIEAFLSAPMPFITLCRYPTDLVHTGSTTRSGLLLSPCLVTAFSIISLACLRLSALFAPIFPSWMSARVNGFSAGAAFVSPDIVSGRKRAFGASDSLHAMSITGQGRTAFITARQSASPHHRRRRRQHGLHRRHSTPRCPPHPIPEAPAWHRYLPRLATPKHQSLIINSDWWL